MRKPFKRIGFNFQDLPALKPCSQFILNTLTRLLLGLVLATRPPMQPPQVVVPRGLQQPLWPADRQEGRQTVLAPKDCKRPQASLMGKHMLESPPTLLLRVLNLGRLPDCSSRGLTVPEHRGRLRQDLRGPELTEALLTPARPGSPSMALTVKPKRPLELFPAHRRRNLANSCSQLL
jgi:hypothetical protein